MLYWREHLAAAFAPTAMDHLGSILESEMAGSADRRAAERIPVNPGTSCGFVGRVIDDVGAVKIRDVSMDGIGLLLMRSVPVGTVLAIGLTNPDKAFARTVMLKVAHVTPTHGGFLVGGSFTEPLTYQELTTLVM